MKLRITTITLNPDHAILSGLFESGETNLPAYNVQIAVSRERAKEFEPGKVYPITFGDPE
jgi:hypothetical protein